MIFNFFCFEIALCIIRNCGDGNHRLNTADRPNKKATIKTHQQNDQHTLCALNISNAIRATRNVNDGKKKEMRNLCKSI